MANIKKHHLFLLSIVIFGFLLRIFALSKFPIGLYSDELALGYNSYSLLKTGKDEFSSNFPVGFQSFGDWKPALPAYLASLSVSLLGLHAVSIRLPNALISTLAIILVYALTKELLWGNKISQKASLVISLLFSVSPWHILNSRALLFESIGFTFAVAGILFFLKGLKTTIYLYAASIFLALAIYSYHSLRIVLPLLMLYLVVSKRHLLTAPRLYKRLITALFLFFLLLFPLVYQSVKKPNLFTGRAKYINIFYDKGVRLKLWESQSQDDPAQGTYLTRYFHNKSYSYFLEITKRYLSHFNGNFLFIKGDTATPFQISNMGFLYLMDLPLVIFGLFISRHAFTNLTNLLIFWLTVSILPSSLTFLTPSSNRIFNAIFPLLLFESIAITQLFSTFSNRKFYKQSFFILIFTVSFYYFLKQYFLVMPGKFSSWWHYGWKELVEEVDRTKSRYDRIIISDKLSGVPYIYFLFYTKYSPSDFQKNASVDFHRNPLGFIHVNGFDQYEFPRFFEWQYEKDNLAPKSLYILSSTEAEEIDNFERITDPGGKILFKLIKT